MPESLMGTHCTTSVIIQVKAEPYLNNFAGRCQCYNLLGNGLMASDLVTTVIMTPPRAHTVTPVSTWDSSRLCLFWTLPSVSTQSPELATSCFRVTQCDTAWHLGPGPRLCDDHITPSQVTSFARLREIKWKCQESFRELNRFGSRKQKAK